MRSKLIVALGFSALLVLVAAHDARSSTITVTTANDYVSITSRAPVTYTGTGNGSNTISDTYSGAAASLTIIRSSSSLDYLWSATPTFPANNIGIRAVDAFTLSGPADFQLTFTGSYLDGYLWNTSTDTYVSKFGDKSGNVGPTPDFTLSGALLAGNYELRLNTGALAPFGPLSGEVHFVTSSNAVPEPATMLLFGLGLLGLAGIRRKLKK